MFVPSKIYPGHPGDIPDIFFDFFNKYFFENISGVSGVKVSKCFKKILVVYIFCHFTKIKISSDLSDISIEYLL